VWDLDSAAVLIMMGFVDETLSFLALSVWLAKILCARLLANFFAN